MSIAKVHRRSYTASNTLNGAVAMSAEYVEPLYAPVETVLKEDVVETIVERRVRLHRELGVLSAELCDVTSRYNRCIQDILETNASLRTEGIDTNELAVQMQGLTHIDPDTRA